MEINIINIDIIKEKALNEDAKAQVELADYYFDEPDKYEEALKWYKKSADNNNADGFNGIGRCYYSGRGVKKDINEAVKYYMKAAEKGSARAMYNLGICYSQGIVVKRDSEKAKHYYSLSAELGYGKAQYVIGCEFMHYHIGAITWQITQDKDTTRAFEWLMKSAKQSYAKAQLAIGRFYETGTDPCIKNVNKAIEWYKKAAEQEYDVAYYALSKIYQYGNEEITQNLEKAYHYCLKAAELGNKDAKVSVGLMIYYGQGVEKDMDKGLKLIEEVAEYDIETEMLLWNLKVSQNKRSETESTAIEKANSFFDEYGVQYTQDRKKILSYGIDSTIEDSNFGYIDYRILKSYVIPEGVEIICNGVFAGCETLEEIQLPNSLRIIGEGAFEGCKSLKNVIIPKSVSNIKASAFSGVKSVISRNSGYIVKKGCLVEIKTRTLNSFFSEYMSSDDNYYDNYYEVPWGIEIIGNSAFRGSDIEIINIPETVKKIDEFAFEGCKSLWIIVFDKKSKLEEIGNGAFYECTRISSIEFPKGLKKIGTQAFCQCSSLSKVSANNNLEEIGSCTFGTTNISEFTLPLNLKEIGSMIFQNSPIKELKNNSSSFKVINNVIYSKNLETLIQYYDSAERFEVPQSVKRISKFAFPCISKLKELIIRENVIELGEHFLYETVPNVIKIPSSLENKFKESVKDVFIHKYLVIEDLNYANKI